MSAPARSSGFSLHLGSERSLCYAWTRAKVQALGPPEALHSRASLGQDTREQGSLTPREHLTDCVLLKPKWGQHVGAAPLRLDDESGCVGTAAAFCAWDTHASPDPVILVAPDLAPHL